MALIEISPEQSAELLEAFKIRFTSFQRLRDPLDELVKKYQQVYNFDYNKDGTGNIDEVVPSGFKYFVPYTFTIIQSRS